MASPGAAAMVSPVDELFEWLGLDLAQEGVAAQDLTQGYLLLEDFGDSLLRELLSTDSAEHWMPPLFDLLSELALNVNAQGLPAWDRPRLQEELADEGRHGGPIFAPEAFHSRENCVRRPPGALRSSQL